MGKFAGQREPGWLPRVSSPHFPVGSGPPGIVASIPFGREPEKLAGEGPLGRPEVWLEISGLGWGGVLKGRTQWNPLWVPGARQRPEMKTEEAACEAPCPRHHFAPSREAELKASSSPGSAG